VKADVAMEDVVNEHPLIISDRDGRTSAILCRRFYHGPMLQNDRAIEVLNACRVLSLHHFIAWICRAPFLKGLI
jgi:hypothetical protein